MARFHDNYSPGCQSCQTGRWLCIYLTYICPAKCEFCPSPFSDDKIISAFGDDKIKVLDFLKKYDFSGIGFSGGDPFIKFGRLVDWQYFFKTELPGLYSWAYTSGIPITKRQLMIMAECGLDEIRFNIAATGYTSGEILKKIEFAVEFIPNVAIEIPSISRHNDKIKSILPTLIKMGVKYLNLHQYLPKVCKDNESFKSFLFNKRTTLNYEISSLKNTFDIIEYCNTNNLEIKINNCSLQKKEEQMRQRRIKMGVIFGDEKDFLDEEGLIHRYIYLKEGEKVEELIALTPNITLSDFINQTSMLKVDNEQNLNPNYEVVLIPPLSLNEDFYVLRINELML